MAERAGEKERAEEGDDRRGRDVSERESAGAGAAGPRCWAARARDVGEREHAVGLSQRGRRRSRPAMKVFVFLFQKCE
jgi:hypothetical protein